jgi:hypothetical protein
MVDMLFLLVAIQIRAVDRLVHEGVPGTNSTLAINVMRLICRSAFANGVFNTGRPWEGTLSAS